MAVNADCLKLTAYFGERERVHGRLLSDVLMDLHGRHRPATSLLLRGAVGFGAKHRLRTDQQLTLSEDLPLVGIAVDARARIEAMATEVRQLQGAGLVTLERARLLTGELASGGLGEPVKLTVYMGRSEPYAALCELLRRHGLAGATVLLGVDGTAHGERRRAAFFGRNAEVPLMVIAVGEGEAVARALPELGGLLRHPLVTLERIRVCRRDGAALAEPGPAPGAWQKLMVHSSDHDAHDALVLRLRRSGASGATTLRGVWGFHGEHAPHGDRLLQVRRGVPAVTVIVDAPERIRESFAIVSELTPERGLVTSETVPVILA
jgi:PII-like signaling protein